ncbi:MAG: histidine triad nucleotide-binding protein [Clostridia bacterium]|nr:histidine triad nucleotide-binding protein [Clostridia bacterium]
MENCLFCKIIAGDIPSAKVYEDENTFAFRDIAPQAPTHVLVVPKKHVSSVAACDELDDQTLAACLKACKKVSELEGLTNGFRVVSNCGEDGCQSVPHLHFHVLGGRKLTDSMA